MTPPDNKALGDQGHDPVSSAPALAQKIPQAAGFCMQQIASGLNVRNATSAALVDQWGRIHPLGQRTVIGREPGDDGVAILESSVSRLHAELLLDREQAGWWLSDLASTNGTFVDGHRMEGATQLRGHELVLFGDIGLVFVADCGALLQGDFTDPLQATSKGETATRAAEVVRLFGATSGAGGLVDYKGNTVQLGSTQFSLLSLLAERVLGERSEPTEIRGFVRSIELITDLPWNTATPSDNNVKQLVRRVRRALDSIGLENAIEARQRFGYRLRVQPMLMNRP